MSPIWLHYIRNQSKLYLILISYLCRHKMRIKITQLFYWALPDKTLNTKDISCKGVKSAKDRLTVMFAGEMLNNPAASKTSEKKSCQSAMNSTKRHGWLQKYSAPRAVKSTQHCKKDTPHPDVSWHRLISFSRTSPQPCSAQKEEEKMSTIFELETLRQVRKIHAETAGFIGPLTGDTIIILEDSLVRKKCRTTQLTIDMFFKKWQGEINVLLCYTFWTLVLCFVNDQSDKRRWTIRLYF